MHTIYDEDDSAAIRHHFRASNTHIQTNEKEKKRTNFEIIMIFDPDHCAHFDFTQLVHISKRFFFHSSPSNLFFISFPKKKKIQDETLNNTTRSELSFVPSTEDDGKSITCRAENPKVTGLYLETTWKLDVVCKYHTLKSQIQYMRQYEMGINKTFAHQIDFIAYIFFCRLFYADISVNSILFVRVVCIDSWSIM